MGPQQPRRHRHRRLELLWGRVEVWKVLHFWYVLLTLSDSPGFYLIQMFSAGAIP